jgi:hypothetical protein
MNGFDNPDSVLSVAEMAMAVGLCRDRFYDLVASGVFPAPARDEVSGRPFYPPELQRRCHEIRRSGRGHKGQRVFFYRSKRQQSFHRRKTHASEPISVLKLHRQLQQLGIDVSLQELQEAVARLFPTGLAKQNAGLVIQRLAQELWRPAT